MKNLTTMRWSLVSIITFLNLSGCSEIEPDLQRKMEEIVVGMTYDEVEKILGKPSSINRGANELKLDVEQLSDEELFPLLPHRPDGYQREYYELEMDRLQSKRLILQEGIKLGDGNTSTNDQLASGDTKFWPCRKVIQTVGALIYVTWYYPETIIDTAYTTLSHYGFVADTTYTNTYFVNGELVTEEEFRIASDPLYFSSEGGSIVSWETWIKLREMSKLTVPPPPPQKLISKDVKRHPKFGRRPVPDLVEKPAYKVSFSYCVVFDASSGRTVTSGYYPILVASM